MNMKNQVICLPALGVFFVAEVITGWDQGCLGMTVGEERKLVIPANEAGPTAISCRNDKIHPDVVTWNFKSI